MKKVIITFSVLLFAVWLGVVIHYDSGYVLVSYRGWTIETSVVFAVIVIIISFFVLHLLLRINSKINEIINKLKTWAVSRQEIKAKKQTISGCYDMLEGNWAKSEKKLIKAAKYSDIQPINYILSAFAAQLQKAFVRRDAYLYQAQKKLHEKPFVYGITKAYLQIENQQLEEAFATLQYLQQKNQKNIIVMQLIKKVCIQLNAWEYLKKILPFMRKYNAFQENELLDIEILVCEKWLKNSNVIQQWCEVPKHLQKQPKLLALYIASLVASQEDEAAEDILKLSLRKNQDAQLLELYAALKSTDPLKKLARAENWLKTNPQNADLLACLGKICLQQQLWGKAQDYLEASLKITQSPQIYYELGKTAQAQHNIRKALDFYTKGLKLVI